MCTLVLLSWHTIISCLISSSSCSSCTFFLSKTHTRHEKHRIFIFYRGAWNTNESDVCEAQQKREPTDYYTTRKIRGRHRVNQPPTAKKTKIKNTNKKIHTKSGTTPSLKNHIYRCWLFTEEPRSTCRKILVHRIIFYRRFFSDLYSSSLPTWKAYRKKGKPY